MKKVLSALLVAALVAAGTATPAAAGARALHRWEGAAIALGAIGIIAALSEAGARAEVAVRPGYGYGPADGLAYGGYGYGAPIRRHPQPQRVWVPGHWETVQVWVPGSWEQVWEPECHDRSGRYVPGRWERRRGPGRYEARRVWNEGSYR